MLVLMSTSSPLRDALSAALAEAGHETRVVEPDHGDPLGEAVGARAVVYVPSPTLRDDTAAFASGDRMRAALTAARAPGVEVLVVVLPLEGYDDELDVLAAEGVPYVVLRAPMLIEELGASLSEARWLLVAKDETVRAMDASAVAAAIVEAMGTEEQGRVTELGRVPLPTWAAIERAAAAAGQSVRVIALWAPLARIARWLLGLMRWGEPAALATCRRLALPPPS